MPRRVIVPQRHRRAGYGLRWFPGRRMRELGLVERLSTLDLSNLRVEDRGLPMHVAALVILDGAAPGAGLDLETVRTVIGQRLHLSWPCITDLRWRKVGGYPTVRAGHLMQDESQRLAEFAGRPGGRREGQDMTVRV